MSVVKKPTLLLLKPCTIKFVVNGNPDDGICDVLLLTCSFASVPPDVFKYSVLPILTLPPELIINGVASGFALSSISTAFPVPSWFI